MTLKRNQAITVSSCRSVVRLILTRSLIEQSITCFPNREKAWRLVPNYNQVAVYVCLRFELRKNQQRRKLKLTALFF